MLDESTSILKEHITGLKIVREEVCDFKDVKALSRVFKEIEEVYDVGEAEGQCCEPKIGVLRAT